MQFAVVSTGSAAEENLALEIARATGDQPQASISYGRVWKRTRAVAFTFEVAASPLVERPHDRCHAAMSPWLNGGVPPTHWWPNRLPGVTVLLEVYARCLVGPRRDRPPAR